MIGNKFKISLGVFRRRKQDCALVPQIHLHAGF